MCGRPFRWGEGWFFEIRDGGLGWGFPKHDKAAIQFRVDLLMDIFVKKRGPPVLAMLEDVLVQEAIADGLVGPAIENYQLPN